MIVKTHRAMGWEECFQTKLPSIEQWIEEDCRNKIFQETSCESVTDFKQDINFSSIDRSKNYLPCYLIKYTYQDVEYTAVINAQTGSIKAERPWGLGKLGTLGRSGLEYMEGLIWGKKRKGESQ